MSKTIADRKKKKKKIEIQKFEYLWINFKISDTSNVNQKAKK